MKILGLPGEEILAPGRACAGCGSYLALRHVLKALGRNTMLVVNPGCMAVSRGAFPKYSYHVPTHYTAFTSGAAAAEGLAAALKAKGIEDITVAAWIGDGGTADIGFHSLSGAAERRADIIYICYDNESYMNTGGQRSGSTPITARTTTTPILGKKQPKKLLPIIMAMHGVSYVATACVSYPHDLYRKVKKAKEKKGTLRYIHILCPCPPGWGYESSRTIEVGRLAVETGMWILYEIEDGKLKLTGPSSRLADPRKRKPIDQYLKLQKRFIPLNEEAVRKIREWVDFQWKTIAKLG